MDHSGSDRWLAAVMHCWSRCLALSSFKGSSSLHQMTTVHQYLLFQPAESHLCLPLLDNRV